MLVKNVLSIITSVHNRWNCLVAQIGLDNQESRWLTARTGRMANLSYCQSQFLSSEEIS